jgi:hypothetical protein
MQAAKAFLLRGFVSFVSFAVMLGLLLLPNIDYDSAFRLHVAVDHSYFFYIRGVNFLPAYQFIAAMLANLFLLRLFSIVCVLVSGWLLWKIMGGLTDSKRAITVTALFLWNPLVLLYGSLAMSESFATMVMLAMLFLFLRDRHGWSALSLTAGVFTSYWFWVFTPFFMGKLVAGVAEKGKRWFFWKRWLWYLLPVLALVSWGAASFLADKNPLGFLSVSKSIYVNTASKNLLGSLGSLSKLSIYTVEYPLLFLSMTPVALWLGKKNKASGILRYYCTSLTVILTAGVLLNVIFGWARYFIPLIPVCLILVGPIVLRSKYWPVWAILYFALGTYGTFLQSQVLLSFQRSMMP